MNSLKDYCDVKILCLNPNSCVASVKWPLFTQQCEMLHVRWTINETLFTLVSEWVFCKSSANIFNTSDLHLF